MLPFSGILAEKIKAQTSRFVFFEADGLSCTKQVLQDHQDQLLHGCKRCQISPALSRPPTCTLRGQRPLPEAFCPVQELLRRPLGYRPAPAAPLSDACPRARS